MNGIVDDELRALIEVQIGGASKGFKSSIHAWIDTAFNGGLVLPQREIERLGLKACSSTSAILADGRQVELPTYACYLDWFGNEYRTQIIANEGETPLLGTMLLDHHDLTISYRDKTLTLK